MTSAGFGPPSFFEIKAVEIWVRKTAIRAGGAAKRVILLVIALEEWGHDYGAAGHGSKLALVELRFGGVEILDRHLETGLARDGGHSRRDFVFRQTSEGLQLDPQALVLADLRHEFLHVLLHSFSFLSAILAWAFSTASRMRGA